jgi:type II secretory pathway component PulM
VDLFLVWVLAQSAPGPPDLSPLAYYGVAGLFLATLLWLLIFLLMAERREHKELQKKVLEEFLPAIIAATAQQREATEALREVASRPTLEPTAMAEWVRTMDRLQDRLNADEVRRRRAD